MSTNIFVYLARLVQDSWLFEGERHENIDYDPEHPQDQPEYAPEPLFFGPHRPLHYLLGYPVATILNGPPPPFGCRGLPPDLSTELKRWAGADDLNRFHGWVTVRELVTFDWDAVTAVRMVVERKHLTFYPNCVENSVMSDRVMDWSTPLTRRQSLDALGPVTERDWPSLAPDVICHWSYGTMAGYDFMDEVIQTLGRRYGSSEEFRIIYWIN